MAQATPDVEQLVSDYEDVWNGDFSKLEVVSESADVYDPGAPGGAVHGRDGVEAYVRELQTGFPDLRITIDDWVARDEMVMLEWTATGTHEGEFDDIPPTGREIDITGMAKILVSDDKIREDHIHWDTQEMFEQLGLTEE